MSRKHIVILVAVICCAAALLLAVMPESDEAKIRKKLDLLAETVSKEKEDGPYTVLGKVEDLDRLFTEDCLVKLEPPARTVRTRSSLGTLLTGAFRMVSRIDVSFHDIHITVDPEKNRAKTVLTATVRGPETEGMHAREILMTWVKYEGTWLISSAEEWSPIRNPGRAKTRQQAILSSRSCLTHALIHRYSNRVGKVQ